MASTSRAFQVKIVGDVNDAKRSLKSMEKRVGGFAKAMKGVAGAMVAAFAVRKVFDFVGSAIKRAEEMNSLYAITAKIIDRTGGAAGRTADEIKDMARQMSLSTGIDKKLITEGTNVLLTFKNIADQAGENNDIFTRSNAIMLDMATVFGGDAKSAATQLGKALNDPITGVTALQRVGVTFTDQQKEQIRVLQESGDILGAQKIILAELEGQVGGTAVASADATAKLKNMANEAKEWIGNKLLPIVEKLADFMVDNVVPAFQKVSAWISENVPPWYDEYIRPVIEDIQELIEKVIAWITEFWKENGEQIMADLKEWAKVIWDYYAAVFNLIKTAVEETMKVVAYVWEHYGEQIMAVVRTWWDVVSSIIGLIIGTLKDLIRFITAVFRGDWSAAWDAIKSIAMRFGDWFKTFPKKLVGYLTSVAGLMLTAATNLGKAITEGITNAILGGASAVGNAAKAVARSLVNAVIGFWNRMDPRVSMSVPSWVPGVGGRSWKSPDLFPDIPYLAKGGIATGPTVAMIGEGRYDEAVIPLKPGMGLGSNTYNITVQVAPGGDLTEAGRQIVDAIVAHERYAGQGWRTQTVLP